MNDYSRTEIALNAAKKVENPSPWRLTARRSIGGLRMIGFEPDTEELLIIGNHGSTVIDCSSGAIIARNREQDGYDPRRLQATRPDRDDSNTITMSGLDGGGLIQGTADNWTARTILNGSGTPFYLIEPPGASITFLHSSFDGHSKDSTFHLIESGNHAFRAFGFSWTGNSLVWACSSDIAIWSRI